MSDAFYTRDGEHFVATEHTRGPWDPDFQHAGPPSALMAHAALGVAGGMHVARLSIDLLKPIPIGSFAITVDERVGGKRRRIVDITLSDANDGRALARASALLLRRQAIDLGSLPVHDPAPPLPPDASETFAFDFFHSDVGYHTAMELRRAAGTHGSGMAKIWMRPRIPLLADEPLHPLERLMLVADSGNGVSMVLDPSRHLFMNPDLTVNVRRDARGEWICLDAMTHFHGAGLGMAESRLWDTDGVVGNGTQNLLLEPSGQ